MSRIDDIKFIFENSRNGLEQLTSLVKEGKVTFEEFEKVTGTKYEPTLEELKNQKIKFIDSYKHEARKYFPYGNVGGIQRFIDEDILSINLSLEGIKNGVMESVTWKYSNGKYEEANEEYLKNMLLKGGQLLNKAFAVEEVIVSKINEFESVDDLMNFNEKEEFDKLFFTEE